MDPAFQGPRVSLGIWEVNTEDRGQHKMATRGIRDCEELVVIILTTVDISASSEKACNYIPVLNNSIAYTLLFTWKYFIKGLKIHFSYILHVLGLTV